MVHRVVVEHLVVDLVGHHHQPVPAREVEQALEDLLRVDRAGRVVRVDDHERLGAVGDLPGDVVEVGEPVGRLVAAVVHGLAAGERGHRGPQRVVGRGHQDLVAVLDQGLHGHGDQLGDPVAEEDVVDVDVQPARLVALGDGTPCGQDAARVGVAVRLREHPDHVLDDLLGRLEVEQRGVAGVQAQDAVPRLLQQVRLLDHRAADLVTDVAQLVRLPELHALTSHTRAGTAPCPPTGLPNGSSESEHRRSYSTSRLYKWSSGDTVASHE